MTIREYISPIQRGQLPNYVRENYPAFEEFIVKYYEWLETDDTFVSVLESWKLNNNPNTALDKYLDAMLADLGWNWDGDIKVTKNALMHGMTDFYSSRGTKRSFRFLFNVLFGEDVKVTYPREKLLIPSAASYVKETVMFLSANNLNQIAYKQISDAVLTGEYVKITGLLSGTFAGIEKTTLISSGGNNYIQLEITDSTTPFIPKEDIKIEWGNIILIQKNVNIATPIVNTPGTGVESDTPVQLTGCAIQGILSVKSTTPGKITGITITSPGTGYSVGNTIVARIEGFNGSGFFARVKAVGVNGEILTIDIENQGEGYKKFPKLEIIGNGFGAKIAPISFNIGGVSKFEYPQPYADFVNATASVGNSTISIEQSATFSKMKYVDRQGIIGESSTLIDSYRNQQFSYDVTSGVSVDKQKGIVDNLLHPFGYVRTNIFEIESDDDIDVLLEGSLNKSNLVPLNYIFTLAGESIQTLSEDRIIAL